MAAPGAVCSHRALRYSLTMSTIGTKPRHELQQLTAEQPESTDPDYLAWKEAKIRSVREAAQRSPDKLVSHTEMRKRLGLDH